MLETRSIQFNEIDGKADLPAWARTTIEGDIHVTAMKEVSHFLIVTCMKFLLGFYC